MMKKKRNFDARFWSGTRKHSPLELLEIFFQFNDLAVVKKNLGAMMHGSVSKKAQVTVPPAEIFHLQECLRSLIRAGDVIGKKTGNGRNYALSESHVVSVYSGSLSEEEYRDPVSVFRNAFKAFSREEYGYFLSLAVYFSLGDSTCDQENRIIRPYLHLVKMLDAAWLIVERASVGGERQNSGRKNGVLSHDLQEI